MFPILFSIGSIHIFTLNVFLILGWLVFSFLFWRALRSQGVPEDRIFDLTFYSTLVSFVFSRGLFVALNWAAFAQNPVRIFALWIAPGMSLYGGLVGALLALVYLARQYKVRLGTVLDAFALSFPAALLFGFVGTLADGTYVGTLATVPWAVRYVGHIGTRHPVQMYEMIAVIILLLILTVISRRSAEKKWPYGLVGLWFFALYSVLEFGLEFLKDTHVYSNTLRANQWILIALFAETLGAFYVRGGGREAIRPAINKVISGLSKGLGGMYAKLSKRST